MRLAGAEIGQRAPLFPMSWPLGLVARPLEQLQEVDAVKVSMLPEEDHGVAMEFETTTEPKILRERS
jgi:hypothetical protein